MKEILDNKKLETNIFIGNWPFDKEINDIQNDFLRFSTNLNSSCINKIEIFFAELQEKVIS